MKVLHSTRAALLCCSIGVFAVPAIARAADADQPQTDPQAASEIMPDIVVTATRQSQKLQDVAMSVNVATGEQLEKFKIFDVKDVQQLAPGLELTNTTGRNNTTTLRGVGFDPDSGTAPTVQVYLNEIPTDAQTVYTAIYDIQQIEVLRGPQGLLRGLSAPAGSITIETRKPKFDSVEGYAELTATDRAGYNVQGGVSLPFSDKLALRVAGLVDGNRLNNVRDVNRGGERSKSRTESARATLGWRPTDNFSAYLTYQHLHADNSQFQQVIGAGNTPTVSIFPYLGGFVVPNPAVRSGPALGVKDRAAVQEGLFRLQNDTDIFNLQADYDLGAATLSLAAAHQFTKLDIQRDLDAANAIPGYVQASNVITPYVVNTAELRLTSNNKEGFGWGVGAFYTKQTGTTVVNQKNDTFLAPYDLNDPLLSAIPSLNPDVPLSLLITVPVNTSTWSFNGNASYKSGPLTITAGVRYSIIKGNQATSIFFTPKLGIPGTDPLLDVVKSLYHPVTGGATISYAITPDMNVYLSYGHSFRAGSHAVAAPAFISDDLVNTKPEKTDSVELGFKGSVLDRKLGYSVAAYYQKLNNFLSRFTGVYFNVVRFGGAYQSSGSFDFNYNGDATIKGIEATLDAHPTPDWDFNVSGAYTRARYKNAKVPCNDYAGTGIPNVDATNPAVTGSGDVSYCISNNRLAEVPDFSLTANTEIRFPMGNLTPYVRALFTYRPGFRSQTVNYNYQDRELLNMFVGVRGPDDRWEFDVFARNLLNQQRIADISAGNAKTGTFCAAGYGADAALCNGSGTAFDSGYRSVSVTNPREFGATLKFRW